MIVSTTIMQIKIPVFTKSGPFHFAFTFSFVSVSSSLFSFNDDDVEGAMTSVAVSQCFGLRFSEHNCADQ